MELHAVDARRTAEASGKPQVKEIEIDLTHRSAQPGMGDARSRVESVNQETEENYDCDACFERCFKCLDQWLPECIVMCLYNVARCVYGCLEQICGWNRQTPNPDVDEGDEMHDTGTMRIRSTDGVQHDGPANLETTFTGFTKAKDGGQFIHTKAFHIYEITGGFNENGWKVNDAILISDDDQTRVDGTQNCSNLTNGRTMRVKIHLTAEEIGIDTREAGKATAAKSEA